MALTLNHQTEAQFADRFWRAVRNAYLSGDNYRFHRLIWWVWSRVQAGDLTNNQVRLTFNAAYNRSLNSGQWNTFVTDVLVPIKDRYLARINETEL